MNWRLIYDAGIRGRDERRQSVVEIELTPQRTGVRGLEQAVSARREQAVRRHRNRDELAPVIRRQPAVGGRPRCAAVGRSEHAAVLEGGKDDRRRHGRDDREARDSAAIGTSPRNVLEHRRITAAGCRRRSRRKPGSSGRAEPDGAEHDHQRQGSRGEGGLTHLLHESSVRPKYQYRPVTKSSAYQPFLVAGHCRGGRVADQRNTRIPVPPPAPIAVSRRRRSVLRIGCDARPVCGC